MSKTEFNPYRSKIQIIFQAPYATLDLRMPVSEWIAEPLDIQYVCKSHAEMEKKINELMDMVGLTPSIPAPKNWEKRYLAAPL